MFTIIKPYVYSRCIWAIKYAIHVKKKIMTMPYLIYHRGKVIHTILMGFVLTD